MKSGIELIAEERKRLVEEESWTQEHDKHLKNGELASIAATYAKLARTQWTIPEYPIPTAEKLIDFGSLPFGMDKSMWKPSPDPIRNLVKSGALIAAEIDRLQALKEK